MDQLLNAIRESPLLYLPEVSLSAFCRFQEGYDERCRMEGRPHNWQVHFDRFGPWLRNKFKMGRSAIELAEPIVLSFSSGQQDAFHQYFALLDEFCALGAEIVPSSEDRQKLAEDESPLESFAALIEEERPLWSGSDLINALSVSRSGELDRKKEFIEIMRPDLFPPKVSRHLPIRTFSNFCAFVMGDERAHQDLRQEPDSARTAFREFQKWVETEKNRALPRPWFKIILFYSASGECNANEGSAFSLFCRWLDEYGRTIGKSHLFAPTERESAK
jgi:hypothetical protein